MDQEARFAGLRLESGGRLTAYLEAGVVRLVPTKADLDRAPGWYLSNWAPAPSPVTGKVTKAQVDYGRGRPGSRCGVCTFFDPPSGCSKVEGSVDPAAWCSLFKHELMT